MDDLRNAIELIVRGGIVTSGTLSSVIGRSAPMTCKGVVHLPSMVGETIVIGPLRGHAAELGHLLLQRWHNVVDSTSRFVVLGNMIDGGDYSCETLFLLLCLQQYLGCERVVLLRGAQEHSFLASAMQGGPNRATLATELRVRELQDGAKQLPQSIHDLFRSLPVACVVDNKYFCVGSGISPLCRTVQDLHSAALSTESSEAIHQTVWNEPMDDDDQYSLLPSVEFASSEEYEGSFVFSFQAACKFLSDNSLITILRGSHYTSDRTSVEHNRCGRPWHYRHASYDAGYRLHACHPHTGFPTVLTLFSAASFCDQNSNLCAYAAITADGLVVQQKERCPTRPVQLPGSHRNAFAWSVPLLMKHAVSAVQSMLTESPQEAPLSNEVDEAQLQRMRQLARLCISNPKYLLPQLSETDP